MCRYHIFVLWLFCEHTIIVIVSILVLIGTNNFLNCCLLALRIYHAVSPCQSDIKGSLEYVDRNISKTDTQTQ